MTAQQLSHLLRVDRVEGEIQSLSKVRSKAGSSAVDLVAAILRTAPWSSAGMDRWCWVVDNRMSMYGEVDPNTFIVRINVAKHKRERQSLIDTLVHEELHILFPRFGEAMICAMTERKLARMSKQQKARLYARIRRR
jgi:hypothetical protein